MTDPIHIVREIRFVIWPDLAEEEAHRLMRLARRREDVADALGRFFSARRDPIVRYPLCVKVRPADGAIVLHLTEHLHEELRALLFAGGADGGHAEHDASPGRGAAEVRGPP